MSEKAVQNENHFLKKIIGKWQENPLYSTGAVLIIMVIVQTFALGFNYPDFGAWFSATTRR